MIHLSLECRTGCPVTINLSFEFTGSSKLMEIHFCVILPIYKFYDVIYSRIILPSHHIVQYGRDLAEVVEVLMVPMWACSSPQVTPLKIHSVPLHNLPCQHTRE